MSNRTLLPLENPIKNYAWGDRLRLGELFGLDNASGEPQAEIWMGAHAGGPSLVGVGSEEIPLGDLIASAPERWLGEAVAKRFGGRLPFLFKVLNAGQPLSIQLHPNKQQAQAGYAREEAEGIPRDAAGRNYRDPNHKPELICALTPFRALCGFRPIEDICKSLGQLHLARLEKALAPLDAQRDSAALQDFCLWLLELPAQEVESLAREAVAASKDFTAPEFVELRELNRHYPGDRGIFFALMLNLVELEPGEALFLEAGHLHSYLGGVGLEIMASSDNVIRGGLTPKHIDCAELKNLATFAPLAQDSLRVSPRQDNGQCIYPTPVEDFTLALINVAEPGSRYATNSAEILFCIEGSITVRRQEESAELAPGQACLVSAEAEAFELEGEGRLARAAVSID